MSGRKIVIWVLMTGVATTTWATPNSAPMVAPNPANSLNNERAAAGSPGMAGTQMLAPAPAPTPGAHRQTTPAPGPGTAPKKAKLSPADERANRIAAKVRLFLQLLGEEEVKITSVRESPVLFEVKWQAKQPASKGAAKKKLINGRMWVTLDGRYMTRRAVKLAAALKVYRKQRKFVDCLINRGLRVLLEPGTKGTAKQLKEVGAFGQELVIWCDKAHKKLCDLNGTTYPRWIWPRGSRFGVLPLSFFETQVGCKP